MALRKFIIERDIPAVGSLDREQLRGAAAKSNGVLRELGPDIQWVESFVAADKTFCVYLAKDEDIIKKHAEISGFPATKITEVRKMIDPTTEHGADAASRHSRRTSRRKPASHGRQPPERLQHSRSPACARGGRPGWRARVGVAG